jgi:hypothetical protein
MPGGKNQKRRKPAGNALGEPAKHVLVRMPVELHEKIIKLADSYEPPRSINSVILELLIRGVSLARVMPQTGDLWPTVLARFQALPPGDKEEIAALFLHIAQGYIDKDFKDAE